jgi:hypothetical protein
VTALSGNAVRLRRFRARDGRVVLPVEVDRIEIEEWLIAAGLLTQAERDDRIALTHALERLLELCVKDEMHFGKHGSLDV